MKKIAEKIIVAVFTVTAGNVFSQGIVNSAQRDVVFTNHMEPMKDGLKLFAFNGITTIRDMLGHPRHLELRTKIKSGEFSDPDFTPHAHQSTHAIAPKSM